MPRYVVVRGGVTFRADRLALTSQFNEGKTQMAPPASAARALHDLLATVNDRIGEAAEPSSYHAWVAVVGAPLETADFARYHAEVIALFFEVAEGLNSLPDPSRDRFSRYLQEWWDALVQPRRDWAVGKTKIISPASLDMLASLADVVEARSEAAGLPNPQGAEILLKAVAFLLGEVAQATDVHKTVREQLMADLRHVIWLLQHVDEFGMLHAVAAADRVTGKVAVAATTSGSSSLRKVAIGLTTALALLASVTGSLDTITTNVRHTFGIEAAQPEEGDVIQNVVVEVYDVAVPKELPPGRGDARGDAGAPGEVP